MRFPFALAWLAALALLAPAQDPKPKPKAGTESTPADAPPKRPKRDVPADNELKPASEIKLAASVVRFLPSKDGKFVYFLNRSDGKIQRLDLATQKLDATEAELTDGTEFYALSPNGKTLYTCASPKGHSADLQAGVQEGKVQVLDAETLKVTSTFGMKFDPFEFAATDGGMLYVSGGSGQWTKVAVVDVKKKAVVGAVASPYMGANLRMTADGKRLYLSTNGLSGGGAEAVILGAARAVPNASFGRDGLGGGPFDLTPDGKFVLFRTGYVGRVGKTAADDLREVAKVNPHRAAAVDVAGQAVWLATSEGYLEKWSYPAFELQETFSLPKAAYELYLDREHKVLYAALDNKKPEAARVGPFNPPAAGLGDIAVFDFSKRLVDAKPGK